MVVCRPGSWGGGDVIQALVPMEGGTLLAMTRLSRAGDRQLRYALHVMALAQIRHDGAGRSCYQRKRTAGKSHKEAMRCLKRRLSDVVYRTMINDSVSSLTATA
jgi:transposase